MPRPEMTATPGKFKLALSMPPNQIHYGVRERGSSDLERMGSTLTAWAEHAGCRLAIFASRAMGADSVCGESRPLRGWLMQVRGSKDRSKDLRVLVFEVCHRQFIANSSPWRHETDD
jgi:hypothetical protein